MKKILILFTAIFLSDPVSAKVCRFDVSGCTFNNFSPSVISDYTFHGYFWSAFNANDSKCVVSGTGLCSNINGESVGAVSDITYGEGHHCWCKMLDPYLGQTVFINTFPHNEDCIKYCGRACAMEFKGNADIRVKILTRQ